MRVKTKIWQPLVRRYGVRGAALVVGVAAALLIGGGASYAAILLGGGGGGAVNLQSGLIGWWKLDGNAKDSTPYANNGTVNGATLTTDREGAANSAYSFTTNQDISIGSSPSFTHNLPFSVSVWFNASSATSGVLINKYISASWNGFNMLFATGGRLCAWYMTGTTNNNYTAVAQQAGVGSVSCPTVTTSAWHHVVVTVASSGMQMYLDGSLAASSGWTGTATNSSETTATVLGLYQPSVNWFSGKMDDVRIYNRVLSSSEATALYKEYNPTLNAASGENGMIGWWKLNGNPKDATPYAHNGTINGSPTATNDREGAANGAYSFNGTTDYLQMPGGSFFNTAVGQAKTYSIWFKGSTPAATSYFYWEQGGCLGWAFSMQTNGDIQFLLTTGDSTCTGYISYPAQTSTSYGDNKWHLATAVVDRPGGNEYLYIDGALKKTVAIDNIHGNTGGTLRIGTNYNNSLPFAGSLSDARIYGRALSGTEAANLYQSYNSQINLYQSSSSSVNLSQGLVGEWDFTGNAKDYTPYSDNGTTNSVTLTADRFSNANSAYSFSGVSTSYISIPSNSHLNSSVFTMSGWVYPTSISQSSTIVGSASSGGPQFRIATSGVLQLIEQNTVLIGSSTSTVPLNTWSHVAVSYDASGNFVFYLNGSPAGSGTNLKPLTFSNYYFGRQSSTVENFTGSIDDVRVYNRVLSAAEVQALYGLTY